MPDLNFRIGADIKPLQNAISQARNEITRGLGSLGGVGGLLTGAGVAAGLQKAVTDHVEQAKEIAKLAQLANASIAEASKLLATGNQFGVTGDAMATAMKKVSSAAANQPELFKAIGVATEDANGHSRRAIDIFTDLRSALSNGANDYKTVAAATQVLGRGVEDLYPLLRASDAQVQAVAASAKDMGLVMSEDDVAAALAFAGSMKVAEAQGNAVQQMIAVNLIPKLGDLAEAAFTAGDMLGALFNTANQGSSIKDVPILGGLSNFITNSIDALAGNPTDSLRRINDEVNKKAKIRADFAKLAQGNLTGGGGSFEFPSLGGGGRDPVMEGLRDRIDAVKTEADERERTMRAAMDLYQREKDVVIGIIQDEETARERQHDADLRAIDDEVRQRQDAFDAIDRARSDEIDALREQIRGTQELTDLEKTRAEVADAEAAAASERNVEIFRSAGQSQNEYGRAVREQQKRIADADKRVADTKKKLEQDSARAIIEARIRAIEEERQAASRALTDFKSNADERIRAIRDQMKIEKDRTDALLANIRKQMAAEKQSSDDAIAALQAETRTTLAELDARVKEHQRAGAAISAAYQNLQRTVTYTVQTVGTIPSGGAGGGGGGGSNVIAAAAGLDAIVGPGFGGPRLILAGEGATAEQVHVGPVGSRSGMGTVTSIVNAYGIGAKEAARLIARENAWALARRAGRGYGRRR